MPAYACIHPNGFIIGTHSDIANDANGCGYYSNGHTHNGAHSIYDT